MEDYKVYQFPHKAEDKIGSNMKFIRSIRINFLVEEEKFGVWWSFLGSLAELNRTQTADGRSEDHGDVLLPFFIFLNFFLSRS